ncbi:PIN domain-containing protein [Aquimarina sp. ERC-38]|uniref:PIN domain-containing protein n=1 Tax=Aquimarina sp. ERC-38 TaxID=2949996 RepID=UPI002B250C63|nr:PIN domain-containing protein [Aquimarina sp. ERC-38]
MDTNVVLDLLSIRKPFYDSIAKIATLAEKQKIVLVVSQISFATVNYFLTKFENNKVARVQLKWLMNMYKV